MQTDYNALSRQARLYTLSFVLGGALLFGGHAAAGEIYSNSGSNMEGFVTKFGNDAKMSSDGTVIVESKGGTWSTLPVSVTGDFVISFDVKNDSYDGDAHLLLVDPTTNAGIDVKNCPQATDTPSLYIFAGTNFATYQQFFFPTIRDTLMSAASTGFPNGAWTHVVITRRGNLITDNVGDQVIQANVCDLATKLRVGLGGYATTFGGGEGKLSFRNLKVYEGHLEAGAPSSDSQKPANDDSAPSKDDSTPPAPFKSSPID